MADEELGLPRIAELDKFAQYFDAPGSSEWADTQTTLLNDFVVRSEIANANTEAGENFATNFQAFGNSLANAASRDPSFVPTALEMAREHVAQTISTNPNLPDEQRQGIYDEMLGGLQNLIARRAVSSLGDVSDKAARALMDRPDVAPLLSDEDRTNLSHYIDMQLLGRSVDQSGAQQMQAAARATIETNTALAHARQLWNSQLDDTQFPLGWAQAMLKDDRLPAQGRVDLLNLNARLQMNGDAKQSDPFQIVEGVRRIVNGSPLSASEVLQNAGVGVKLADALMLVGGNLPLTNQQRNEWKELGQFLEEGQRRIAAPENGAAGARAFGRFVNWLMPQYRQGGTGSLNVNAENYIFRNLPPEASVFDAFQPNAGDLPIPVVPMENRPSLQEIFAGQDNFPNGRMRPYESDPWIERAVPRGRGDIDKAMERKLPNIGGAMEVENVFQREQNAVENMDTYNP